MINSITIGEITCYSVIIVMAVLFLKIMVQPFNKFVKDVNPLRHKKEISKLQYRLSELNFELAVLRAELKQLKAEKNETSN